MKRHARRASGHYLRPVLKSLPGVPSQLSRQEERWEARNFKSKHQGHVDQRHAAAIQEKNELSLKKRADIDPVITGSEL